MVSSFFVSSRFGNTIIKRHIEDAFLLPFIQEEKYMRKNIVQNVK